MQDKEQENNILPSAEDLKLQEEIALREKICAIIDMKIQTAANDNERGKLTRAKEAVNIGDFTNTVVKKIHTDIKRETKKIEKLKQTSISNLTVTETIEKYNFYTSSSNSSVWYYQALTPDEFGNRKWISIKKDALQVAFPATNVYIRGGEGEEDYSSFKEFNVELVNRGRVFNRVIQSYKDQVGALNIMNRNFCPPAEDGSTDYHWIFDAVFETISGGPEGDAETFEALQRTIWAKYLHPDSPYIPNPTIRDINGRAGKNLWGETMIKRLFNGNIAGNCNSDHVIGKFNGVIAGQAVVIVNETNRSKIDSEKTKAFLGSPSILVENKYQVPYWADNTCLVIFFTNEKSGGVNVSGTNSDNRFSFFKVEYNIYQTCQRYFKQKENRDLTIEQVKHWIEGYTEDSGQRILANEYQVGKWINAMLNKHGDVAHVEPVHGKEHKEILNRQRGAWTQTVERIFEDLDFQYIRANLLADLVREYNKGEMLPGRNHMREEIQRLVDDRGYDIELVQRGLVDVGLGKTKQYPIWRLRTLGTVKQDESAYVDYDAHNGRQIWVWKN